MQATITYLLTEQAQRAQMAATGQPVARKQVVVEELPLEFLASPYTAIAWLSSKRVERMGRCPEGTRMSRWFTGRFYGMTPLRANLRTANTISWKVKLILHYCGLWQHQA